jgi:thiol-disulfide isomerase/thioredoxin
MKLIIMYGALVALLVGGIVLVRNKASTDDPEVIVTPYDTFAQCITDAGAKFYGAFWCPHCQAQKKLLGNSKKIPYTECSTPDGKSMNKVCSDAGIDGYPTWIYKDGTKSDGEQTLAQLSEKTNCALPAL